jgi:hypothetical protein
VSSIERVTQAPALACHAASPLHSQRNAHEVTHTGNNRAAPTHLWILLQVDRDDWLVSPALKPETVKISEISAMRLPSTRYHHLETGFTLAQTVITESDYIQLNGNRQSTLLWNTGCSAEGHAEVGSRYRCSVISELCTCVLTYRIIGYNVSAARH